LNVAKTGPKVQKTGLKFSTEVQKRRQKVGLISHSI